MSVAALLRPIVTIDGFKLTFYRVGVPNASTAITYYPAVKYVKRLRPG
jgi:hypothetical protein